MHFQKAIFKLCGYLSLDRQKVYCLTKVLQGRSHLAVSQ